MRNTGVAWRCFWMLLPTTWASAVHAQGTVFLDIGTGLPGYSTGGTVSVFNSTDSFSINSKPYTLAPATGYSMAKIAPTGAAVGSVDGSLGLAANSIENLVNTGSFTATNFGYLTKSFTFVAGQYSFAWAYAANDYVPFNDGVLFSVVGSGTQDIVSLARNGSGSSDTIGPSPGTLVLGSYGTLPWQTATFTVASAGTYQVSFASYNELDQSLDPILYVSGIQGTYSGTPPATAGSTSLTIGTSGGNVSPGVFNTSSPSYSQPTLSFDGGTLQYIGNTTTTADATLSNNGGGIDTQGFSVTYAGTISGVGGLTVSGTGPITLTAVNAYTGSTTIGSGAALALAGSGSIAASSGVVTNGTFDISATSAGASITSLAGGAAGSVQLGSQTLTILNAAGSFAGTISGSGGLVVAAGTETLSGNNAYTGATAISTGGTLALSGAGGISQSSSILANGTLDISGASAPVSVSSVAGTGVVSLGSQNLILTHANDSFGGVISGAGGLVVTGGTETLTGTNTYGGGTLVSGSKLVIASDAALGASSGSLALQNATLETLSTTTMSRNLSVDGAVTLSTDANTITTLTGTVSSGSTAGCFTKAGAGSLVLGGLANLSNGTCVVEGQLSANGILNSNTTVAAGGTLRGTGLINGTVSMAGRLAPGNSPGTLSVAGTVTLQPGSVYQEDINGTGTGSGPGNYSRLLVLGANNQFIATGAALDVNLLHITGTATYTPYVPKLGDVFRVVTADGGIVGRFATFDQPEGLASGTRLAVYYDVLGSNSIDLRVVPLSYASYAGSNSNGRAAAGALDALTVAQGTVAGTTAQSDLSFLVAGLPAEQIPAAMTGFAGELHVDLLAAAPQAHQWLQGSIERQLDSGGVVDTTGARSEMGMWFDSSANRGKWGADERASEFSVNHTEVALGFELLGKGSYRLGVGFLHSLADISAAPGAGTEVGNTGFIYGQYSIGTFSIDGMMGGGGGQWELTRSDTLGLVAGGLRSSGQSTNLFGGGGVRWTADFGGFSLTPYARTLWQRSARGGFDEGTALDALRASGYSASGIRSTAGLSLGSSNGAPLTAAYTFRINLGAGYDEGDLVRPVMSESLGGQNFLIQAPEVSRVFGQFDVQGTVRLGSGAYAYLGLADEVRSGKAHEAGVNLGARAFF